MMSLTTKGKQKEVKNENKTQVSLAKSQLLLLQSRKKWGILYSLATVTGLFFVPSMLGAIWSETEILAIFQKAISMPLVSFLVTVGMFVLNDLVDADLDRANGKNRPIPSGLVSKRQTWTFILLTNGIALLLSVLTFNLVSILIVTMMLVIGIVYSAPKIALMKRFVIKTVTIAIYYSLCALLGMTSIYGLNVVMDNPIVLAHGLSMLVIMIVISSMLNDLGDVAGDRAAGRRTVPIVIGKDSTIKLSMILALCMLPVTWTLYGLMLVAGYHSGIVTVALTSLFGLVVASKMVKMRQGLHDVESMRKHHRKLFPLNLVLQFSLVAGGMFML
jgi:geranylgeranylglycerol-phosphate geranylgeranyltransferase